MVTTAAPEIGRPAGSVSYSDDLDWFAANFDRIVAEHPDAYLAIRNGKIVVAARSPSELREQIKARDEYGLLVVRSHPDALLPIK